MRKLSCVARITLSGLLSGSIVLALGSCTTQTVKTQFANGLSGALNGLFNVATTDLANEIFDVDD